ncbi:MAG: hypothetical protein L6R35_004170 [Caloplaca aegaea]|nr:MAG: hypothetical protein L6R35_004170 [Caloplaca aegaea]
MQSGKSALEFVVEPQFRIWGLHHSLLLLPLDASVNIPFQQRFPILFSAAERQLGPLHSAIPLCTHNSSQAPHLPRPSPPPSLSLLRQILDVGTTANAWADLYPSIHWSSSNNDNPDASSSRRLLTSTERYRLRRACYRIWLYSLAYHHASFPRYSRRQPATIRLRAALLRGWSTAELAEILDLQAVLRKALEQHICPSNGTVIRRHKERYGHDSSRDSMLIVNHHLTCPSPPPPPPPYPQKPPSLYYQHNWQNQTWQGWGDDVHHFYVLEDMLKFDPGEIYQLYDFCAGSGRLGEIVGGRDGWQPGGSKKTVVETHVAEMGDWFVNNGQTLGETVGFVVGERGEDEIEGEGAIVHAGV